MRRVRSASARPTWQALTCRYCGDSRNLRAPPEPAAHMHAPCSAAPGCSMLPPAAAALRRCTCCWHWCFGCRGIGSSGSCWPMPRLCAAAVACGGRVMRRLSLLVAPSPASGGTAPSPHSGEPDPESGGLLPPVLPSGVPLGESIGHSARFARIANVKATPLANPWG